MEGRSKIYERPERKGERDDVARELRALRKGRDDKRKESQTILPRLKSLINLEGNSRELHQEADKLSKDARQTLIIRKEQIKQRDTAFIENELKRTFDEFQNAVAKLNTACNGDSQQTCVQAIEKLEALGPFTDSILEHYQSTQGPSHPHVPKIEYLLGSCLNAFSSVRQRGVVETDSIERSIENILQAIDRNLSTILTRLEFTKDGTANDSLELLSLLIMYGNDLQKERALHGLYEKVQLTTIWNNERNTHTSSGPAVAKLYATSNSETYRDQVRNTIDQLLLANDQSRSGVIDFVADLCEYRRTNNTKEGMEVELLGKLVKKYDLDARSLMDRWWQSDPYIRRAFIRNMRSIDSLEKIRPGSSKLLNTQYGISDFGRYPVEILSAQVDAHEKNDLPYGVVIYPYADHNGAFYQDRDIFSNLLVQLSGKYYLRVLECSGKRGVARALITLDRHYGEDHKLSFAIIGGHGTEDSIHFGNHLSSINADIPWKSDTHLYAQDLQGSGIRRSESFFEAHPTLILASCSTGRKGGIAQQLSQTFNATVIGPDEPAAVKTIEAVFDHDGSISFKVEYLGDELERIYANGQEETTH